MTKIVITASSECSPESAFVVALRKFTDFGVSELKTALKDSLPIFEEDLFLNNHETVANRLRGISELSRQSGVALRYFELPPDEDFKRCSHQECEISDEIMANLLGEWERRRNR